MVTCEAFLPLLEKSTFPRIVNVTSSLGSISFQLTPTVFPVDAWPVSIFFVDRRSLMTHFLS